MKKYMLITLTLLAVYACSKDEEPKDKEQPTLISLTPSNGATSVSIHQDIIAVFSEDIDPLSVTSNSFRLISNSDQVSGTLSVSGNTITFSPSASLAYETVYKISGTSSSITDLASNPLTKFTNAYFTTEDAPDTTGPTVKEIDPANGAKDIFITRDVVVTFSENVDVKTLVPGQSIKLVKEGSSSSIDGTINMAGSTLTYRLPELELSTKYIFTLSRDIKDLAGNAMSPYTSSFTTVKPTDNTPPTVTSISPTNGENYISYEKSVQIIFSEALDPATVNSSNFYISKGGDKITSAVSLSSEKYVKINPQSDLRGGATEYKITITNQVKDLAGNNLANQFTSSFKTINDNVAVQSRSIGATDVAINGNITITFNVDIDPSSVNSSNVFIRPTTSDNGIASTLSVSGKTVTINPNEDLKEFETGYVLTVRNSVKDQHGNYPDPSQFLFYTEQVSEDYKYQIRASNSSWTLLGSYIAGQDWVEWNTDGKIYCNNIWYFMKRSDGTYVITHDCTPGAPKSTYLEGGVVGGAAVMNDCYCTGQFWTLVKDKRTNNSTLYSLYTAWQGEGNRLDAQDQIGMQPKNLNDPQQYWQLIRVN